jgi:hypothetical protein
MPSALKLLRVQSNGGKMNIRSGQFLKALAKLAEMVGN